MADRLRNLPARRLAFAFVTPLGFSVLWFVMQIRLGHTAWAVFFGSCALVSVAIIVAAITLKVRAHRPSN